MNFLIIEDDYFLASKIKKNFENKLSINRGKILSSYEYFLEELYTINCYDIILVDLDLGSVNKNGFDIIKLIREKDTNIPIIVITGTDNITSISHAFDIGANDYIIKPFRFEELHVRALKRLKIHFSNLCSIENTVISYNGLDYNLLENEFYFKSKRIFLTKKNKYLLLIFLSEREKFLSTDYLVNKLWGNIDLFEDKNIRVYICRLKNILKNKGIDNWINNIRGEGYIFKK